MSDCAHCIDRLLILSGRQLRLSSSNFPIPIPKKSCCHPCQSLFVLLDLLDAVGELLLQTSQSYSMLQLEGCLQCVVGLKIYCVMCENGLSRLYRCQRVLTMRASNSTVFVQSPTKGKN